MINLLSYCECFITTLAFAQVLVVHSGRVCPKLPVVKEWRKSEQQKVMDIDLNYLGMDKITGQRVDAFFLAKHTKSLMNSLSTYTYIL